MKIAVTGGTGFLGKNFINKFSDTNEIVLLPHDKFYDRKMLIGCEFLVHFAAVQKGKDYSEFYKGNVEYTKKILSDLETLNIKIPILFTNSIRASGNDFFSKTKRETVNLIKKYCSKNEVRGLIFLLNNIYGPYARWNHNNVIATYCYNLVKKKPIIINDPSTILELTYVDDLMQDISFAISDKSGIAGDAIRPSNISCHSLGEIAMILGKIKNKVALNDVFEENIKKTFSFYERILS